MKLYRRRLIPDETVHLKDDEIVFASDGLIVTTWRALKPRHDFSHGRSCYFIREGYKISRMFREDGSPLYYYCDIIETERGTALNEPDSYIFTDLLFDVVVHEDGFIKVLDLDEAANALADGILTTERLCLALAVLQKLLDIIYSGGFGELTQHIDGF